MEAGAWAQRVCSALVDWAAAIWLAAIRSAKGSVAFMAGEGSLDIETHSHSSNIM
jgi:hypothetical protein